MDNTTASLTWANVFTFLSGVAAVVIPLLVNSWLNSKKTRSEIHQTESQSDLNRASLRSLELRDDLSTGESIGKMLSTLVEAGDTIRKLQQQVFDLREQNLRAEADAKASQMFVDQLNAAAKLAGVRLSDYTPKQLKEAHEPDC